MRDVIDVTDEVLSLSDVEISILFGLITKRTALRFTAEQWNKIADKIVDPSVLPNLAGLLEDLISLQDEDIRSIFLSVGLEKGLPYPIIPFPPSIIDPVFISKSRGEINGWVYHVRKTCSACNPTDKNSFIEEVERSEVDFMNLCPICILERNKDRR